ncbi:MAG: SDR family oxidoreductase [Thermosynechococcaceae cyanobacterium MS004]|nr:SDR family oxidoreductase [Thermosynechococcaceae cyanobacterium MS004]
MDFTGKTIIITGASAGIGRALAIALSQKGSNVALAARNEAGLQDTAHRCRQSGGQAIVINTDVSDPLACQQLIEHTVKAFGQIDGLVNNAGTSFISRFDEISDLSIFEKVMQINYLGAVYCTHAALPYLKQSQGLLVAISSLCGKTGVPLRSGYVASKHAMQGFFDTLRIELLETGVDVLVVSPGFVATEIREKAFKGDGTLWGRSHRDESHATMPLETCVDQILRGMSARKREVIMTPKGKLIPWAKLIVPRLVDKMARRTIANP